MRAYSRERSGISDTVGLDAEDAVSLGCETVESPRDAGKAVQVELDQELWNDFLERK